jgi:hypothetical protein
MVAGVGVTRDGITVGVTDAPRPRVVLGAVVEGDGEGVGGRGGRRQGGAPVAVDVD